MGKENRTFTITLVDCEDYQFEQVMTLFRNLIYPCTIEIREIKS